MSDEILERAATRTEEPSASVQPVPEIGTASDDEPHVRSRITSSPWADGPVPLRAMDQLATEPRAARRGRVRAGFDGLALIFAAMLGYLIAEGFRVFLLSDYTPITVQSIGQAVLVLMVVPGAIVFTGNALKGHYVRRRPFWSETADLLRIIALTAAAIAIVLFATKFDFSRTWTVAFLAVACIVLPVGRVMSRRYLTRCNAWFKPAVIVADGDNAFSSAISATESPDLGLEPAIYIPLQNERELDTLIAALEQDVRHGTSAGRGRFYERLPERPHVIVALENMDNLQVAKPRFDRLMQASPVLTFLPPMTGLPLYHSELMPLFRRDGIMIRLHNRLHRRSSRVLKRFIDLSIGGTAALLLSPFMALIALAVRWDGGGVIYAQRRIGANGDTFHCLKFRTMVLDAEERLQNILATDADAACSWELEQKLRDDPRITPVGRLLRRTSLDELPQLLNVLRGDMSLVGPRPIVEDERRRYGSSFDYYCKSLPGITGLWQVSGRNDVSYDERVRLDVWYARNWSPWLDLVILCRTIPIVLTKSGAY